MKCEHCGKNEVTFVYRSNINGKVEEKHLCADCAEKLGYTRRLAARNRSLMRNFNSLFDDSFFGGGLLGGLSDGFFSGMPALMGRMLDNPFDDFFTDMPALNAAPVQKQEEKKEEQPEEPEEENRFDRWRRLNALRHEMKKAVKAEDFERAAQIRDEIRQMEAEDGQ